MRILDNWYAAFDNSELMAKITDTLFRYLPEAVRVRMPHHVATYLLLAALCFAASLAMMWLPWMKDKAERAGTALAVTAIGVGLMLVLAIPLWGDGVNYFVRNLARFGKLFASIGSHFAPFQLLGLLGDLLYAALLIVAFLWFGLLVAIPAIPALVGLYLEIRAYGVLSPIAFFGHSIFGLLVVAMIGVGFATVVLAMLPFALVIALLCVMFFR